VDHRYRVSRSRGLQQTAPAPDAPATSAGEQNDIVLVDTDDVPTGVAAKTDVHRFGLRHRAISIFVRNAAGELLIQRRSEAKYHSGGLWANACCSHPRPGEAALHAAHRRLPEEMGFDCPLAPLFKTHYRAVLDNGYVEDEVVHAFAGAYDGPVAPDPAEVSEWRWIGFDALTRACRAQPQAYAVWFRHYLDAHGDAIAAWLREAGSEDHTPR
jgi:isopentenyl-diphosphate delta-isomerase